MQKKKTARERKKGSREAKKGMESDIGREREMNTR